MTGQGSVPIEALYAAPDVQWRHIDGPMLHWAGHQHWLTWQERLRLWLGLTDVEQIAEKYWPARRYWAGRALVVKSEVA